MKRWDKMPCSSSPLWWWPPGYVHFKTYQVVHLEYSRHTKGQLYIGKRQIVRILKSRLLVHQNIDQYPVLSDAQTFHCSWPDCPGGNPAAAVSCHSYRGGPEDTEGRTAVVAAWTPPPWPPPHSNPEIPPPTGSRCRFAVNQVWRSSSPLSCSTGHPENRRENTEACKMT